jgi:hypothetical protein
LLGSPSSLDFSAIPNFFFQAPQVFVAFTFSGVSVVAGSVYAIVITASNAQYDIPHYVIGDWFLSDSYAGGTAYSNGGSGWVPIGPTWDLAFKTYVELPQISLSPTCGPPGTVVIVTGSSFIRQANSFCDIHSTPAGLVGPNRGTDFDCNINAQGEVTGPDGPAFFTVAVGASGSYSVTVYYGPSGQESDPVTFSTNCPAVGGVILPVNTFAWFRRGLPSSAWSAASAQQSWLPRGDSRKTR